MWMVVVLHGFWTCSNTKIDRLYRNPKRFLPATRDEQFFSLVHQVNGLVCFFMWNENSSLSAHMFDLKFSVLKKDWESYKRMRRRKKKIHKHTEQQRQRWHCVATPLANVNILVNKTQSSVPNTNGSLVLWICLLLLANTWATAIALADRTIFGVVSAVNPLRPPLPPHIVHINSQSRVKSTCTRVINKQRRTTKEMIKEQGILTIFHWKCTASKIIEN